MATYFASDFHLGVAARHESREREDRIVAWLNDCLRRDAEAFYLVGDLFEFWFEWRHAVPRGYVRFLGKLAEITDAGLPLHIFTGNHDLWMRDYLATEIGAIIHHQPLVTEAHGYRLLIGHGDGLGPGDHGYKRLKRLIGARWAHWAYSRLHPNLSVGLANWFSGKSRQTQPPARLSWHGAEREWLAQYAERRLARDPALDYCIFGHRHLPIDLTLSNGRSHYVNLGEWLHHYTYARLDEGGLELCSLEPGFVPANLA